MLYNNPTDTHLTRGDIAFVAAIPVAALALVAGGGFVGSVLAKPDRIKMAADIRRQPEANATCTQVSFGSGQKVINILDTFGTNAYNPGSDGETRVETLTGRKLDATAASMVMDFCTLPSRTFTDSESGIKHVYYDMYTPDTAARLPQIPPVHFVEVIGTHHV